MPLDLSVTIAIIFIALTIAVTVVNYNCNKFIVDATEIKKIWARQQDFSSPVSFKSVMNPSKVFQNFFSFQNSFAK